MRILIQDPVSKSYFNGADWNSDAESAQEFESVAQAETFCKKSHITRAFIVVKFNDATQDIRYPIGPRGALVVAKPPTTRIRSLKA